MNVIEAIYGRRAVRAYAPRAVDDQTLRSLLLAAVHAPSAMNAQPWMFAVVQDRARLARYSDLAKRSLLDLRGIDPKIARYDAVLRDPKFNIFYDAGTLVAIGAEAGTYAEADCWLAAEALMLAAHATGLGTCPIGFAVAVLNRSEVKKELGFPDSAAIVAPLIVGYPSTPPADVARNDPLIVSWIRSS
jgi:nitroreductase